MVWVIRGGEQDRLVDLFVDQGVIGVGYAEVPDAEILTRSEIRPFITGEKTTAAVDAKVAMLSAFVREIQAGDSVLIPDVGRGEVVVGMVTGRYEFHGDVAPEACRHRRTVEWLARHPVVDLPVAVRGVAKQRAILEQHRDAEWSGHMTQVREQVIGRDPQDRPARSAAPPPRRASRAATPRATKPVVAQRTCPGCFLQTHPDRFVGEFCADCAS